MLLKDHAPTLDQTRVISFQSPAVRLLVSKHLENFLKCWKQWKADFCESNSNMLEAKLVHDIKIKVVPYVKHYNFALVNSSMQGL